MKKHALRIAAVVLGIVAIAFLALMLKDTRDMFERPGYDASAATGVKFARLARWIPDSSEFDVTVALQDMGHEVRNLGVRDELHPIRDAIEEWKPHIVFNLMEEFQGEAVYDQNVVAYLELLRVPYTGCGTRGLVLARDKALSKKLVTYHRVRAPRFAVFRARNATRLEALREVVGTLLDGDGISLAALTVATREVVRHAMAIRENRL